MRAASGKSSRRIEIAPTTIAGAAALLRYASDVIMEGGWAWSEDVGAENEDGTRARSWSDLLPAMLPPRSKR